MINTCKICYSFGNLPFLYHFVWQTILTNSEKRQRVMFMTSGMELCSWHTHNHVCHTQRNRKYIKIEIYIITKLCYWNMNTLIIGLVQILFKEIKLLRKSMDYICWNISRNKWKIIFLHLCKNYIKTRLIDCLIVV